MQPTAILSAIVAFALFAGMFWKGGLPERIFLAFICLRSVTLFALHVFPWWPYYDQLNIFLLMMDFGQAICTVFIFLNWRASWLIPVISLQIFPFTAHLAMALGHSGMQRAYWVMVNLPLLAQVLVVFVAVIRNEWARFSRK